MPHPWVELMLHLLLAHNDSTMKQHDAFDVVRGTNVRQIAFTRGNDSSQQAIRLLLSPFTEPSWNLHKHDLKVRRSCKVTYKRMVCMQPYL